ncbi:hypothetical protein ABT095_27420 [Kitasatospora sp. NPDC002227]|uniref:hypothetical protein n=1 Tax=Kitasatospora sp. NPDC002227 TaxID=3154773 RepID=UPI0033334859
MPKPSPVTPLKQPRKNILDGLAPWQMLLALLPLALLFIGGAIGGVFGALGLLANVKVAKAPFATPLKATLMAGVVLTTAVVYLAVAAVVATLLKG